jgi:hypothetical protein
MTFKDAYAQTEDWKKRVFLISMFHNARKYESRRWKLTDSAEYFDVSIGIISEALTLVEHWTSICDCSSRNQALMRLKNGRNVETPRN